MDLSNFGTIGFFGQGMMIGLAIAAPVGPIGVLCIRRTLVEGQMSGLLSGLGAATADAIYGMVAAFGLTLVSDFLIEHSLWIRLLGGAFLCYLGVKTFLSRPADETNAPSTATATGLASAYGSTVVLTLTNPATILSFAVVFAGLGLASAAGDYRLACFLVFGVFCGSAVWWLLLSGGVSFFRNRFSIRGLRWLNRVSGLILIGFGVLALSLPR